MLNADIHTNAFSAAKLSGFGNKGQPNLEIGSNVMSKTTGGNVLGKSKTPRKLVNTLPLASSLEQKSDTSKKLYHLRSKDLLGITPQ